MLLLSIRILIFVLLTFYLQISHSSSASSLLSSDSDITSPYRFPDSCIIKVSVQTGESCGSHVYKSIMVSLLIQFINSCFLFEVFVWRYFISLVRNLTHKVCSTQKAFIPTETIHQFYKQFSILTNTQLLVVLCKNQYSSCFNDCFEMSFVSIYQNQV